MCVYGPMDLYEIYWVGSLSFSNKFQFHLQLSDVWCLLPLCFVTEERLEDLRCRHGMQAVRCKKSSFGPNRHGYGIAVGLYMVRCEWIHTIFCNSFDFFRSLKLMMMLFSSFLLDFFREMERDWQDLPGRTLAACGDHHGGIGGEGNVGFSSYQLNIEGRVKLHHWQMGGWHSVAQTSQTQSWPETPIA